ncbi:UrcA family protein [Brevundimonas lenta]|uniref:UrcA family protein n=1 Tax=Brevundimonas lenta TaxID=424796 RepID=A0A7W6JBT1_9CAUL|nr:UrcA family protein [Brevundimonas lenta]MBB4081283.1 UrcA family protein [Brevundimonas lenta]
MKVLASLAAVVVMAAAGTASAQVATIEWRDLNLATVAGGDTFDVRVDAAANRVCRFSRRMDALVSDRTFCLRSVRQEAVRQLPRAAQVDYAQSRRAVAY